MLNKRDYMIGRDLKRILCASGISILVLSGVMIFSPLSSQFNDEGGAIKGGMSEWDIDSLVEVKEYQIALNRVDSIITEKGHDLFRFPYFDRFLSEKERYDASILRAEIYDLQWKRIEILQATNDNTALKVALEDYSDIIGYNQERAKSLLNQINKR